MSSGNGDAGEFSIIAEKTVPDTYADSVIFELSYFGMTMEFGQQQRVSPQFGGQVPHVPRVRVHMSPQHAKIMAKVLVLNVKAYEEQMGKIPVPEALRRQLGIEEDW